MVTNFLDYHSVWIFFCSVHSLRCYKILTVKFSSFFNYSEALKGLVEVRKLKKSCFWCRYIISRFHGVRSKVVSQCDLRHFVTRSMFITTFYLHHWCNWIDRELFFIDIKWAEVSLFPRYLCIRSEMWWIINLKITQHHALRL